jgi:hypothetical protein
MATSDAVLGVGGGSANAADSTLFNLNDGGLPPYVYDPVTGVIGLTVSGGVNHNGAFLVGGGSDTLTSISLAITNLSGGDFTTAGFGVATPLPEVPALPGPLGLVALAVSLGVAAWLLLRSRGGGPSPQSLG